MKKLKFKYKIVMVMFLLVVAGLASTCFAEGGATVRKGFLDNINELKEISDVMDIISDNHVGKEEEISKKKLMQGALDGMVRSLDDPYSVYFSKEELESFQTDLSGKYSGVGMVIQKKVGEPLTVVSPIDGTPASKAGIKPKDKIIAIDEKSTLDMKSEEAVNLLKGEEGTDVKVNIYRESTKENKEIVLTRATVELKYVKSEMKKDGIGYLRITQFGEDIYGDVAKNLESLQKQGMKGLLLDLRNNPGGALDQAVKIGSMFLDTGYIVEVKGRNNYHVRYNRTGKYYGDFPVVILVNEGSASASEIVSGALKDTGRGTLVGEKTFGKGSVQKILPLPDGDGIKLTIAKYYTPSGISIHGIGIEPDVKVEEDEDYLFYNGMITNVDEKETKENKKKVLEEIKGKEEADKELAKKDKQMEKAIEVLKKEIAEKK